MLYDIFSKEKVSEESLKVVVDHREKNSLVVSELVKLGFLIEWGQLPVGDYIVNGTAVERKTVSDLCASIKNRRVFSQLNELQQYEKRIIMIEGILEKDLYSCGIHENAMRGFILSVGIDYKTPLAFTFDERDSAKYMRVLARRGDKPETGLRAKKKMLGEEEQARFVLEGFPGVGPTKARKLIEKFGSLESIFCADENELEKILGIKAVEFKKLLMVKFKHT